jgi:hypothetical protein
MATNASPDRFTMLPDTWPLNPPPGSEHWKVVEITTDDRFVLLERPEDTPACPVKPDERTVVPANGAHTPITLYPQST